MGRGWGREMVSWVFFVVVRGNGVELFVGLYGGLFELLVGCVFEFELVVI